MSELLYTCARCGITDSMVLNLDTGGKYHPELMDCIAILQHQQDKAQSTLSEAVSVLESLNIDAVLIQQGRRGKEYVINENTVNQVRDFLDTHPELRQREDG